MTEFLNREAAQAEDLSIKELKAENQALHVTLDQYVKENAMLRLELAKRVLHKEETPGGNHAD